MIATPLISCKLSTPRAVSGFKRFNTVLLISLIYNLLPIPTNIKSGSSDVPYKIECILTSSESGTSEYNIFCEISLACPRLLTS